VCFSSNTLQKHGSSARQPSGGQLSPPPPSRGGSSTLVMRDARRRGTGYTYTADACMVHGQGKYGTDRRYRWIPQVAGIDIRQSDCLNHAIVDQIYFKAGLRILGWPRGTGFFKITESKVFGEYPSYYLTKQVQYLLHTILPIR
jgi:hypothetical protein